jgi:hypothetical protein
VFLLRQHAIFVEVQPVKHRRRAFELLAGDPTVLVGVVAQAERVPRDAAALLLLSGCDCAGTKHEHEATGREACEVRFHGSSFQSLSKCPADVIRPSFTTT